MIVVDTSALMAIILNEAYAVRCRDVLRDSEDNLISAGTLAEAMIVAGGRGIGDEMAELVGGNGLQVVDVTEARSRLVADAYRRWGKGYHRASLNFGDCFAYALAQERNCPLLFVGNDFAQTDIVSAIAST
ncbi:MAG: type II toxin-antitoxin system VapC family toxin [Mesorhizobium sp.]|nr:type II toxin-antitoxin system VapC family toxin [Mesorhizobium sp.]MCO5162422.1 type II toxin-antitoxin system VapC family toxin [Mesorhizobium sp.]